MHRSVHADLSGGHLAAEIPVGDDAETLTGPHQGAGLVGAADRFRHLPDRRRGLAPDDGPHVTGHRGLRAGQQAASGEPFLGDHGAEVAELECGRIGHHLPRVRQAVAQRVLGGAGG